MASTGQEPLLGEEEAAKKAKQQQGIIAAAVIAVLVTVVLVYRHFDNVSSHWGNPSCYTYTGNGCALTACHPTTNATCGKLQNCYCQTGCVGADGVCQSSTTKYELIKANFRIKNVKWPDNYIYAPATTGLSQLRVCDNGIATCTDKADKWSLYKVPGQLAPLKGQASRDAYFIQNDKFPGYAAAVTSAQKVEMFHIDEGDASLKPFNPQYMMQSMCKLKDNPKQFKIAGHPELKNFFSRWYVGHGSWLVKGWSLLGEVGSGGYWEADPPLPDDVLDTCP